MLPRSKASSVLGIILEFISASNTTLSVLSSPSVTVPEEPAFMLTIPWTVRLPPISTLVSTFKLPASLLVDELSYASIFGVLTLIVSAESNLASCSCNASPIVGLLPAKVDLPLV